KFPTNELGMFSYIEVQGPFARFVEDLIYILPILAGPDGHDPYVCPVAVRDSAQLDLKRLRVAFYVGNGIAEPRADIGTMMQQVAAEIAPLVESINEAVPEIDRETYTKFEELFFYGGERGRWLRDRMRTMGGDRVDGPFQTIFVRAEQREFSVKQLGDVRLGVGC